jgi:heat shock protein HtpX
MFSNVKVFVLMAGLTALLGVIGQSIAGGSGLTMALVFAAVMNVGAYFFSSSMVLRMYRAKTITMQDAPQLYGMVDRLRQRAGLPMPTVAIAPHAQPNAFATGRNPTHAVVCVTEGIMGLLTEQELEGVIAHELAHIKNRDMLLQTVAATMAGAVMNIAQFAPFLMSRDDEDGHPAGGLLVMILAPIGAMLIQFAISRQREFKADAVGAEISGQPLGLANALRKLEAGAKQIPMHVHPAAAPLAQVNPLAAYHGGITGLFSTHPSTAERVARLEAMATTVTPMAVR